MAAIVSAASGVWSATATWAGGFVPAAVDDVTIAKNHVVTLDATTCVALTVALAVGTTGTDVGGKLVASTTVSSKLTVQVGITPNGATGGGGSYSSDIVLDMSTVPALTCEIVINNALSATLGVLTIGGNFTLKGPAKNEWSELSAGIAATATSATVLSATGWRVGDTLIFAATGTRTFPPEIDIVTIVTVDTATGAVTWTGGVTFAHAAGATVGNFTRNVRIRSGADYAFGRVTTGGLATQLTRPGVFEAVELYRMAGGAGFGAGTVILGTGASADLNVSTFSSNAFNECDGNGVNYSGLKSAITRSRNVFCMRNAGSGESAVTFGAVPSGRIGPDTGYAIFRASLYGINAAGPEQHQTGHRISGIRSLYESNLAWGVRASASSIKISDCKIWNATRAIEATAGSALSDNVYGAAVFASSANLADIHLGDGTLRDTGSNYAATPLLSGVGVATAVPNIFLLNRDDNLAKQELYTIQSATIPAIQRNTAIVNRSTSSAEFTLNNSTTAQSYAFEVLAKAGETIRILVYVRKSSSPAYGASTLPFATITGLGITPVTATMAAGTAADAWELLTLNATNSGSVDGNLTVTLTAQTATAGAKAFFSGLPVSPFVTRARHYGYLFDETTPTRTANITFSAAEETAKDYIGITISWGATSSVTAFGADQTFQRLYDYSQAHACLNVGSALPLTGAGVAGSPALFAAGNVTITTGWKLNGSGSISMSTYTLSSELTGPIAYTYTGGTWSQNTTVPTVNGGQLNIGAAGTYTLVMGGSTIFSMTPTAASTYNMSGSTFTGTVDLRNTTAHAITVQLPSGTANTTANNTGGIITVSAPQLYQSVTVNGLVAGSRVQIYSTTTGTELSNTVVAGTTVTWTDSAAATASRAIRVRIANVSGVTAYQFVDVNIGTVGILSTNKDLTYLAAQILDSTYNTNAIDGSLVTGMTIVDASFLLNITTASVTWPQIYAYQAYWLFTAAGIVDQGNFINSPDTANYLVSGFKIKNTSSPVAPLEITGGYGRDAITGRGKDIYDTSAGSIFPSPDHAIPYSSGSGLTAGQAASLAAVESKTAGLTYTGTALQSDMRKTVGQDLKGNGTTADKFRSTLVT